MEDLSSVPVVDVKIANIKEEWPSILQAVQTASFIAIDCELSGLGDRKKLNAKSVEDRYMSMCSVARTRAILSLGLSCYKYESCPPDGITEQSSSDDRKLGFVVETFNILLLCSENYVVEPLSLRFLVQHGFDFNDQCAQGISYYRGPDKNEHDCKTDPLRQLFAELVLSGHPIVLHNGLVDLVFLYQNFYTSLPQSMSSFVADLAELFPAGIYDTKYITEFKARFSASFLEYVFRRCQRDNLDCKRPLYHVEVGHPMYAVDHRFLSYIEASSGRVPGQTHDNVCAMYASYGFCQEGSTCTKSHDAEWVLDNEQEGFTRKREKRKRKLQRKSQVHRQAPLNGNDAAENIEMKTDSGGGEPVLIECCDNGQEQGHMDVDSQKCSADGDSVYDQNTGESSDSDMRVSAGSSCSSDHGHKPHTEARQPSTGKRQGHRAGFDAFMTGYIFAFFMSQYSQKKDLPKDPDFEAFIMDAFKNKIALNGKDVPLQIMKSSYSKPSKEHKLKMEKLKPTPRPL